MKVTELYFHNPDPIKVLVKRTMTVYADDRPSEYSEPEPIKTAPVSELVAMIQDCDDIFDSHEEAKGMSLIAYNFDAGTETYELYTMTDPE